MPTQVTTRVHRRTITVLVVVLALASLATTVLDLVLLDVWVPEALGLTAILLALAAWTASHSTWAPAVAGCLAALATIVNLLSPFIGPRLVDPGEAGFFVVTWIATVTGILAAPVGVTETVRRRALNISRNVPA